MFAKRKPNLVFLMCVTLGFVACGDAQEGNNGEEEEPSIPDGAQEIIDQEDLNHFEENGFEVYRGSNPPNIEGSYLLDDSVISYDEDGESNGQDLFNYTWSFSDQSGDEVQVAYSAPEGDSASGIGGFLAGDGDCFTLISEVEGTDSNDCSYARDHLISGCIAEDGLEGGQTAYVTYFDTDDPDCTVEDPRGTRFVTDETDDFAPEVNE